MATALTIVITLLLIAAAARVIHLLNAQHSQRIALHHYGRFQPAGRGTRGSPARPAPGVAEPSAASTHRDQRDSSPRRPRRRVRQEPGR
ncbi:hypothetical protein N4G70_26405 [Streptomyces sp. ASQP_92]|uniref:hypothetical protein n=1 Tax=Streptomyces sp. ASQP_92 TaxID=2979116 RepID=UPI0021BEDE74|nr:hypothetical protein [Streptomyces sp. ASQP_92]MCT9092376.1 hypothetical protein [Streptomyces sp. ASQP_92]